MSESRMTIKSSDTRFWSKLCDWLDRYPATDGNTVLQVHDFDPLARIAELEAENARLRELSKMPNELTAENGAKELLIGEFFETETMSGCGNSECECCNGDDIVMDVPISWNTIKAIYRKIREHYAA